MCVCVPHIYLYDFISQDNAFLSFFLGWLSTQVTTERQRNNNEENYHDQTKYFFWHYP